MGRTSPTCAMTTPISPGGDLHPRVLLHGEDHPELPAPAGHEQVGLIAGFAVKGDDVVAEQLLQAEALDDQPDFGGANFMDGLQNGDDQQENENPQAKSQDGGKDG